MHRLRHLRSRVPHPRRHARHRDRPHAAGCTPGPHHSPGEPAPAWQALGDVTRESLKPARVSPWGDLFQWRTSERPNDWQVWRSMVTDMRRDPIAPCQEACPAGTDAGRYVGLIGQGKYDEAYAVAAEVNPFPSVCGWICPHLARPPAVAARWTSRSRSGASSALPPSRGSCRRSRPPGAAQGEGRHRRRGPAGMSAAYYLARLATESPSSRRCRLPAA